MKENLLVYLNSKEQMKKWRNISIFLICIILILFLGRFSSKEEKDGFVFENSIARIKIDGIIVGDDYRNNKIEEITKNDKIKAVILDIDSPGGVVTPSEVVYDLIYKLNKVKPVVVLMDGMATSGAYMIALGSDYLIARNTTLTGSIGVLLQSYDFVDLASKLGIELKTFKSTQLKGMPSMFEKNTEISNVSIQSSVNDIYKYFTDLVKERRNFKEKDFKLAINGQAFTGREALKIGLIDEIGDINSALKYLESKKINTKLPIKEINLRKKEKLNLLEKLTSRVFFNLKNSNEFELNNGGLLSIYNLK